MGGCDPDTHGPAERACPRAEERRMDLGSLSPTSAKHLPGGAGRLLVEGQLQGGQAQVEVVELSDGSSRPVAPEGWELGTVSSDGKWALCSRHEEFALYPL